MTAEPQRPLAAEAWPATDMPDGLTGLATRADFNGRLRRLLAVGEPRDRAVVAIVINLDDFRGVNTLYGAATGDQVLRVTGERLASGTRSRAEPGLDLVARLGDDEFALLCGPPTPSGADAEALAARLLRSIESPIAVDGNSVRVTARAGLVVGTAAHRSPDDVLRDLDLAARRAKTIGPGSVVAWRPSLTDTAIRRSSLAAQLRRAFDNGEFVLHYQPVLALGDSRLVGAEGLLRWNNPSEGLLACAVFAAVLEETGLIADIGNWVLRETVRQVEMWDALYGRDIVDWVGVNLSPGQLGEPGRLLATLRAIDAGGFSLHRLTLEIPAAAFTPGSDSIDGVLDALRGQGVRIAIDDFGTGHVWPGSLQRHPVDAIKIDGEFIAGVGTAEGEAVLRALLGIAGLNGAALIAEGIETPAQQEFLRQAGCGFGQGYLFAEPMDGALFGTYALTHAVQNRTGARLAG